MISPSHKHTLRDGAREAAGAPVDSESHKSSCVWFVLKHCYETQFVEIEDSVEKKGRGKNDTEIKDIHQINTSMAWL